MDGQSGWSPIGFEGFHTNLNKFEHAKLTPYYFSLPLILSLALMCIGICDNLYLSILSFNLSIFFHFAVSFLSLYPSLHLSTNPPTHPSLHPSIPLHLPGVERTFRPWQTCQILIWLVGVKVQRLRRAHAPKPRTKSPHFPLLFFCLLEANGI